MLSTSQGNNVPRKTPAEWQDREDDTTAGEEDSRSQEEEDSKSQEEEDSRSQEEEDSRSHYTTSDDEQDGAPNRE
jgi:hypothetical protein